MTVDEDKSRLRLAISIGSNAAKGLNLRELEHFFKSMSKHKKGQTKIGKRIVQIQVLKV